MLVFYIPKEIGSFSRSISGDFVRKNPPSLSTSTQIWSPFLNLFANYQLGIVWYLVPDENHLNDGRHIDYLSNLDFFLSFGNPE